MKKLFLTLMISLLAISMLLAACSPAGENLVLPTETTKPERATPTAFPTFPTRTATQPLGPSATLRPTFTPIPTSTPVPSLTTVPTKTATPGVEGLGVDTGLFRDDFSDGTSGWANGGGENYGFGYFNGGFRIFTNQEYTEVGAARSRNHKNISVSVDARKLDGPDDAYFGVTCRENASSNYDLVITGDGRWAIYKVFDKDVKKLASGESDAIKTGSETNHIEGRCIGTTLVLYVNDVQVGSVVDTSYPSGAYAGIIVGTFSEGGIDVFFDNFVADPSK